MVEHIIEQTAQKVKENQNLQNTDYLDAEGLKAAMRAYLRSHK